MTKIIINDNLKNVNLRKLNYLGAGKHGRAYEYEGKALKIFRKRLPIKYPGTLEVICERAKMFTNFKVRGWKFATELVLKRNRNVSGYFSELIENKKPITEIQNIPIEKLIEQLIIVRDGADKIALEYQTEIKDARIWNFIWNGEFNNFDCDKYCYCPNQSGESLMVYNREVMTDLATEILVHKDYYEDPVGLRDSFKIGYKMFKEKYNNDKKIFISDYIEDIASKKKVKTICEALDNWYK